ncbi:hypothetical protein O5706_04810 [Escherichia coli]|nr:hypothetical protein [Escherichia coli]
MLSRIKANYGWSAWWQFAGKPLSKGRCYPESRPTTAGQPGGSLPENHSVNIPERIF